MENGDVKTGVRGRENVFGKDVRIDRQAGASLVLERGKEIFHFHCLGELGGGEEVGIDGAEVVDARFLNEEVGCGLLVFEKKVEKRVAGEDAEGGDGAAERGVGVVVVGGERGGKGDRFPIPMG